LYRLLQSRRSRCKFFTDTPHELLLSMLDLMNTKATMGHNGWYDDAHEILLFLFDTQLNDSELGINYIEQRRCVRRHFVCVGKLTITTKSLYDLTQKFGAAKQMEEIRKQDVLVFEKTKSSHLCMKTRVPICCLHCRSMILM